MSLEFDEGKEPRDFTRYVWGGIVLAAIVMLLVVSFSSRKESARTQAEVKHILVKYDGKDPAQRQRALETITDLRKRILAGESFEKLAKEYSDDPQSGARGGYLGWGDKGIYDKNFDDYVWNGKLNEVSEVVSTTFGYHLIVVMDRKYSDADKYDQKVEEEAKKQAPGVEITTPKGIPAAQPAAPEAPAVKVPALSIPPAQAVPPAEAVPPAQAAPQASPAPAPAQ